MLGWGVRWTFRSLRYGKWTGVVLVNCPSGECLIIVSLTVMGQQGYRDWIYHRIYDEAERHFDRKFAILAFLMIISTLRIHIWAPHVVFYWLSGIEKCNRKRFEPSTAQSRVNKKYDYPKTCQEVKLVNKIFSNDIVKISDSRIRSICPFANHFAPALTRPSVR